MKKSIIAALLMAGSTGAMAAENGGYVGVGLGSSSATSKDASTGYSYTATSSGTTTRVFGGVRSGNFAVEGEYIDLRTFSLAIASFSASGFGVSAVGFLPLAPEFSFYGKVGLADITTDATPARGSLLVPGSQSKVGVSLGLGAQFEVNQHIALRVSLDSYADSALAGNLTGRVGVLGLSGMFKF